MLIISYLVRKVLEYRTILTEKWLFRVVEKSESQSGAWSSVDFRVHCAVQARAVCCLCGGGLLWGYTRTLIKTESAKLRAGKIAKKCLCSLSVQWFVHTSKSVLLHMWHRHYGVSVNSLFFIHCITKKAENLGLMDMSWFLDIWQWHRVNRLGHVEGKCS